MLNLEISDLYPSGSIYKIPIRHGEQPATTGIQPDHPWYGITLADEYFLVAYESNPGIGYGARDTGLFIWHIVEHRTYRPNDNPPLYLANDIVDDKAMIFDLEVATGRYRDPSSSGSPAYWQLPDAEGGVDNLDDYVDAATGVKRTDFRTYLGSPNDLFNFGAGEAGEFSYRTISPVSSNPSTFGYSIPDSLFCTGFARLEHGAQSVPNSISVRIVGKTANSVIVDIELAPRENVISPNGGELFVLGQSVDVEWTTVNTLGEPNGIIDTVDIYFEPGLGAPTVTVATGVDASLGAYSWVPAATDVTENGRIRIVCHNIYDATHVGEDESDAVFRIVPSPQFQISPTAEYPILSDNPDTTTVIAVRIADPSASGIDTVTIDVSSFADPLYMTLPMLDDGEGDDAKKNDGIFTSPRFVASVPSGTTSLNALVFAQAVDGGYATQAVTVEVVTSGLKFVDASDETDKLKTELDGDPYSSIYFKLGSDGTGYPGLMVSFDDASGDGAEAKLFQQWTLSENEAPRFSTDHFWLGGNAILTPGSRGLSYADFDNDGDQDLFVCQNGSGGNNTRLYLNTGTVSAPSFEDATAAVFGVDQVYLEDAHAASWGDYNRDGFVDLFVATLAYGDQVKSFGGSSPPSGSPYAIHFFKNIQGRRMAKTNFGASGPADACLSGVWTDLDNDGNLDVVTTLYGSGALFVYHNLGYVDAVGDVLLAGTTLTVSGHAMWGATSVSVLDYDHDPYPDLVVVQEVDPREAVILRNRMGEAIPVNGFAYVESLGSGRKWTGSVVGDFDLNGQEDILLVPRTGEPGMYLGYSSGQRGQGATFRDLGYTLGLRAGKHLDSVTSGAICADFNEDHDYDLFLGRFKSDPFFYRNVRPGYVNGSVGTDDYPAASQKWVEVDLSTDGNSNASLIGTKVTVSGDGDKKWTQTVSGGSGRGGQGANQLIFGLGNLDESTTSVNVSVSYPSGDSDSATIPVGTVWSPEEDTGVTLKGGTKQSPEPASSYELFPGGADWVFKWKTVGIKGDLREDKVEVENGSGYLEGSPCYAGIPAGTTEVLSWDSPDVDFRAYWDGNYWQHVVTWRNRPCVSEPACSHRFRVTSGIGDGTLVTSGWAMTKGSGFCIPDVEGEN